MAKKSENKNAPEVRMVRLEDLTPYENNPRLNDAAVPLVAESIRQFGFRVPIIADAAGVIVAGHTRYRAAQTLGMDAVPVMYCTDLTEEQVQAFRLVDNKVAEAAEWDLSKLNIELSELQDVDGLDLSVFGFEMPEEEEPQTDPDEVPEVSEDEPPQSETGKVYALGRHRLMCGDSTEYDDVSVLMGGEAADMVFCDPPYGMKKEKDGVANDNLNLADLLEFNNAWVLLSLMFLRDSGSWYCWGIDEPLMDIYAHVLRPQIDADRLTFRNLITWDKGHGQGQMSAEFRMYAVADEKCLFLQKGHQSLTLNAGDYFEEYEPLRLYLLEGRKRCGWDVPEMKRIAGHSDTSRDHWTSKSQWNLPTRAVYGRFAAWATEHGVDAFRRPYDDIRAEYETIRAAYDGTRAYFDNCSENMNNVWHFERTSAKERESTGGHATPKPVALCERAVRTSCPSGGMVLDMFGGSGSTLIAAERTGRTCYMMEVTPRFCDVIRRRYAEHIHGKGCDWQALTPEVTA